MKSVSTTIKTKATWSWQESAQKPFTQ